MGIFTFKNVFADVAISGITESVLPPLILNMTITGSVVILFVLLARLALKKAPKVFSYALWAVVLFRLLCPVSVATDFSLLGLFDTPAVENTQYTTAVEYIPYDVVHTPNLEVTLPVPPAINDAVNEVLPQEHAALGADPLEGNIAIGSFIWMLGIAAMAIYSCVSYIRLRRKLVGAVLLRDNIYLADGIGSPFVMGFFRPKIYLPSVLSEQEQRYIILHEQHHIRRGDHIIKALAFIALCIHWFNPLVWVAFILSSKDMEMSCDEAVVKKMGEEIRADYSASLLSLATGRRIIAGTPLAFGEGDTKRRIKNMLSWKKPALWITVLATVVCIVVLAVCGTNATSSNWIHLEEKSTESGAPRYTWNLEQPIQSWAIYEDVYSDGELISSVARISDGFEDNGGASGRNDSFCLDVTPIFAANYNGFINELKVVYEGAGKIEWTVILPHSYYSASAGHNRLLSEPADIRNRFELKNNDEIILYSQLFSTAEDGTIYTDDLENDAVVQYRLVVSTEGLEKYMTDQIDSPSSNSFGTAKDVSYYLELAAGETFQDMSLEKKVSLLVEYEDLLDDYTLIARESKDGTTTYIVGQYNGDPTQSPLHGMYSIDMYAGEEEYFRFLYREEAAQTVEAVVAANQTEFPPSAGYRIEDSQIIWTDNSGCVLIQPKTNELFLDVPWNRYFYTPNGREYIADAVSRGIDVCGRTDTYLYVYRIDQRFGEIAERIALTEAEAQAILAEDRVKITDGFGFSASLHIDGQTTYYNEREGIPQTVLDLAVEKCDYRFGDPSYITDTIREARLDCDWLDAPLYADEAKLPRLREILKNAEHGYVGSCGYGAKLTLTFTGGEKLTVFKGCDGCDTIVFGSYGGYFLGEKENIEFWEMFGLDPDTKERIETNPAEEEESEISVTPVTHSKETLDTATYRVQSYLNAQFRNNPNTFRTDILYLEPDLAESARAAVRYFQRTDDLAVSDPTRAAQMIAVKAVYFQDWFLDTDSNQKDAGLQAKYFYVLPNEVVPDRWYIHDKADTSVPAGITSPADSSVVTSYMTIGLKSLGSSAEDAIAQLEAQDSFSASIARSNPVSIYNRSGDTPVLYIVTKDGHVGEMPLPYADEVLNRAEAKNTHLDTNYNILCYDAEVEKTVRDQATGSPLSKAGKYRFIVDLESLTCAEIFTRTQEFTAEDVNFSGRALTTTPDEMTYEERLSWVQAGPDYQQTHFTSLGQYAEGDGCIAYLGQWVGVPHMNQYRFDIRFADGTTSYLPLPDDGGWGSVPPDTMSFQHGKFIYEMTFPTTEVTNEGNTLIHLQGTYHYEVDIASKTVSLTVLQ